MLPRILLALSVFTVSAAGQDELLMTEFLPTPNGSGTTWSASSFHLAPVEGVQTTRVGLRHTGASGDIVVFFVNVGVTDSSEMGMAVRTALPYLTPIETPASVVTEPDGWSIDLANSGANIHVPHEQLQQEIDDVCSFVDAGSMGAAAAYGAQLSSAFHDWTNDSSWWQTGDRLVWALAYDSEATDITLGGASANQIGLFVMADLVRAGIAEQILHYHAQNPELPTPEMGIVDPLAAELFNTVAFEVSIQPVRITPGTKKITIPRRRIVSKQSLNGTGFGPTNFHRIPHPYDLTKWVYFGNPGITSYWIELDKAIDPGSAAIPIDSGTGFDVQNWELREFDIDGDEKPDVFYALVPCPTNAVAGMLYLADAFGDPVIPVGDYLGTALVYTGDGSLTGQSL